MRCFEFSGNKYIGSIQADGNDDASTFSGFQLPQSWSQSGTHGLYVRTFSVDNNRSTGTCILKLDTLDSGLGGGANDDLTDALEKSLKVRLQLGESVFQFSFEGNTDRSEPYSFTVSNSAELVAFVAGISTGLHTAIITLTNPQNEIPNESVEWSGNLRLHSHPFTNERTFGSINASGNDDLEAFSGFQLPQSWSADGLTTLYVRGFKFYVSESVASLILNLNNVDSGGGAGLGDDLASSLETTLQVQVKRSAANVDFSFAGNTDLSEPYLFDITNSTDVARFLNAGSVGVFATTIKFTDPN